MATIRLKKLHLKNCKQNYSDYIQDSMREMAKLSHLIFMSFDGTKGLHNGIQPAMRDDGSYFCICII